MAAARRTRPAPKFLADLLEKISALPGGMKTTEKMRDSLLGRYPHLSPVELEREFTKQFECDVQKLPRKIQRHIRPLRVKGDPYLSQRALRRYNELAYSLDFLNQIAAVSASVVGQLSERSKLVNEENVIEVFAHLDKETLPYIPRIVFTRLPVDDEGKFNWDLDPLLGALKGQELLRIRACGLCGRTFWAGRMDKPTCSTKCGQVFRKRRQRHYKEALPAERRQQYNEARKKKRKRESTR